MGKKRIAGEIGPSSFKIYRRFLCRPHRGCDCLCERERAAGGELFFRRYKYHDQLVLTVVLTVDYLMFTP